MTTLFQEALKVEFIFRGVFEYIQHWYQQMRLNTLTSLYKQRTHTCFGQLCGHFQGYKIQRLDIKMKLKKINKSSDFDIQRTNGKVVGPSITQLCLSIICYVLD
jgi:hypothetical protein